MTEVRVNPHQIREFLNLPSAQAIGVVLSYRSRLLDLNLSPNTINTRLAAIKSLVNHARKLSQCGFSLEDVASLKVEVYRDTSGVEPDVYRVMIGAIDRERDCYRIYVKTCFGRPLSFVQTSFYSGEANSITSETIATPF